MKAFFTIVFFPFSLLAIAQKRTSVNVKTLGVKGDGITDDTYALQKAIDHCGKNGNDVYLPAGTYIVSAVFPNHCLILSYDGMEIKGDGDKTVLKNKDYNANSGILLVQAADPARKQIKNVRITNFKIDGNKLKQKGLYEQKLLRLNISNNVNEPSGIIVSNMTCNNAFSGILPTEGGGISLEGWDKSLRYDVLFNQNIEIYNNVCNDNGGWGIGTNWSSGFNIHHNRTSRNATMGITVWNSANGVVKNNTVNNSLVYDINLEVSDNILVDANTVTCTADGGGIRNHNSIHTVISNNSVTFNSEWYLSSGISVTSGIGFGDGSFKRRPSVDVLITKNTCISTGGKGTGIRVYHYLDAPYPDNANINIRDNTVQNSITGKCMEVYGSNISIRGNRTIGNVYLNGKLTDGKDRKRNILQDILSVIGV